MRRHRRRVPAATAAGLVVLAGTLAGCGSGRAAGPARSASPSPTAANPATTRPAGGATPAVPSAGGPAPIDPAAPTGPAWTTYQGSAARLGQAGPTPGLAPLTRAWSDALDGQAVYGQPLVFDGRVIVATEGDNVYALDVATGRVAWQVSMGAPLRHVAAAAGCGDVDPLGITSTPVIDPATGTVYVVGEVSTAGRPPVHHQLVGISIASGRVTLNVNADPALPAGQSPLHLLQRAALALAGGRVYVGYGGQYGDCGAYSGWVVGMPTTGPGGQSLDVTPDALGGAVWDGGSGPAVGPSGTLYVTTGNPDSPGPAPWAEAVLKLDPGPVGPPVASFQDRAATGDMDLSTGGPVLLPGGLVFAVGKTDIGYLLRRSDLAPVAEIRGICGSDPDGGAAYDPATDSLYVPCRAGGIQQVDLAGRRTGWRAGRANSTPVLAGGALWALRYPDGVVQELDPVTGRVLQSVPVGRGVAHFASLSVAGGLVLVPTSSGVEALRGPGRTATP